MAEKQTDRKISGNRDPPHDRRKRGYIKVRESLEDQTMNMAKAAAKLFEENLRYSNGEPVKVVISDTTIGTGGLRRPHAQTSSVSAGVDITLTVTPCLVLRRRDHGYGSADHKGRMGIQRYRASGSRISGIRSGYPCTEGTSGIRNLRT